MNFLHVSALVQQFKEGDRSAFGGLYLLLYGKQYISVCRMLGDRYAAEDVTQDVFLKTFCSLKSLKDPQTFMKWLGKITRNCTLDCLQKQNRTPESLEGLRQSGRLAEAEDLISDVEEEALEDLKRQTVRQALELLPDRVKSVVLLKYYGRYQDAEISGIMGIPLATVRSRLARSKQILYGTLYPLLFFETVSGQTSSSKAVASKAVSNKAVSNRTVSNRTASGKTVSEKGAEKQ